MPFRAILRHDFRSLWQSRLVRLWLAATAILTLLLMVSNWRQFQTAPLIASLLFPYLVFPWFLVVMVLGINPVTGSRADALADGILCRPVARYECLLATWASRLLIVWGVFLVVMVPAIVVLMVAKRPVASDTVTVYGVIAALAVVGLVLAFQVSFGFLLGTWLRRPLLAVVLLVFVWFPINLILHTFSLEEFSPISLNQALPTLLRQPWRATSSQPPSAASEAEMEALARQASQFLDVLSGKASQPAPRKDNFFEQANYEDFSLWRVTLGYGIPTVLSVVMATWVFSVRDL